MHVREQLPGCMHACIHTYMHTDAGENITSHHLHWGWW